MTDQNTNKINYIKVPLNSLGEIIPTTKENSTKINWELYFPLIALFLSTTFFVFNFVVFFNQPSQTKVLGASTNTSPIIATKPSFTMDTQAYLASLREKKLKFEKEEQDLIRYKNALMTTQENLSQGQNKQEEAANYSSLIKTIDAQELKLQSLLSDLHTIELDLNANKELTVRDKLLLLNY